MEHIIKKQSSRSHPKYRKLEPSSPSIMQSLDSISALEQSKMSEDKYFNQMQPDVTLSSQFTSLNVADDSHSRSFLLIDGREKLQVNSAQQFAYKLRSAQNTKVKVVAMFGNTGDGKSFTLNHTFFNKAEVFRTCSAQDSGTLGAWAAYADENKVICIDTEGLLGSTQNENHRTRLLLKILAISDMVIYRTRSERLHRDMFTFLGTASRAFTHHFHGALLRVGLTGSLSSLGPSVIIFHETRHTRPLNSRSSESAEDLLRSRFAEMKLEMEAFSSLRYIGVQTEGVATDFTNLQEAVTAELNNTSVRSPRHPSVVYQMLKVLNDKFSGELEAPAPMLFPDQYFTCPDVCLSCGRRCESSMGHLRDDLPHCCVARCRYQHQYENCVYLCKKCHANGVEQVVCPKAISNSLASLYGLAKYMWSGYNIDCPQCGEIYTSRQYWYGNKTPEESIAVRTEIVHVWPGSEIVDTTQVTAQKVLDGVSYLSETVASVCGKPSKMLSSYVADQIAPKYWKPNHEIQECHGCGKVFTSDRTKHHCRSCGEGFCDACSCKSMPVPQHGWYDPVRVCRACFYSATSGDSSQGSDQDVLVRKYGEAVVNTISTVLDYPRVMIKDTARPSYWIPDKEITNCSVCEKPFGAGLILHHCRDCGKGVCDSCSPHKRPVPKRGWTNPVRICDSCYRTC